MTSDEAKSLAVSILACDTEDEVIALLREAGYWEAANAWRDYGDSEGNYSIIGTQQNRPEAALVEKIVNSVDARLMNECLVRGIDPTSPEAPQSIRAAVAEFIEGHSLEGETSGSMRYWDQSQQLEQSRFITLAVTGPTARKGLASLTIVDQGEGQSPDRIPDTFLSLDRRNKLRIPFVQGKFNMGGTGALRFCGKHGIQVILTKRNPAILEREGKEAASSRWGFTVVRRVRPKQGAGEVRNSIYKYLAPVGSGESPGRGEVLSFEAAALNLVPEQNKAYSKPLRFGSTIKLFEYDMKGFKSHALMKDGLLFRLGILLPGIALPVRIHECRAYRGVAARSFENTLVGFSARLEENRAGNLEEGFPTSVPLNVSGETMTAEIYAFKGDRADTYRTVEGIIFTVNGQTHGYISKPFFTRSRVKMGRLARSVLVVVECSKLSTEAREDLFMNSRDRLSNGVLRQAIERELEELIGRHPGLRELQNRRRAAEIADRLKDSRPLEEVLSSILKSSPSLSQLFLHGQRLSAPHKVNGGGNGDSDDDKGSFEGKKHPTYFRFHKRPNDHTLARSTELGRRTRVKFETDVENDYFARDLVPGSYEVEVLDGAIEDRQLDHSLTLHDGVANWSINLPEDDLAPGDRVTIQCTVGDATLVQPFINVLQLQIQPKSARPGGGNGNRERRKNAAGEDESGSGGSGPGDRLAGGMAMPEIIKVTKESSYWTEHEFDDQTGCKVVEDAVDEEDPTKGSSFTFYVNVDNVFLRTDMKGQRGDAALIEAKFVYGNVLVGLALLHEGRGADKNGGEESETPNGEERDPTERVAETTRALAPFLIPMIDNLGALTADEVAGLSEAGEEE